VPVKGHLEEPLPAIVRKLVDFLQHQAEQPRSQSGSNFLKVQYAYWDSELDCKWRGKDGEVQKLIISKTYFLWRFFLYLGCFFLMLGQFHV